jgi:hypothetical protein
MTNHSATPAPAPSKNGPAPHGADATADAIAEREKAEQKEVAGRYKNDGQMPHKGAR